VKSLARSGNSTNERLFSPEATCVGLSARRVLIQDPSQEQTHEAQSLAVDILMRSSARPRDIQNADSKGM